MEGWDGTPEGLPTELTAPPLAALRRRAAPAGSGAARRWRCVRDGRANPHQLVASPETRRRRSDGLRGALLEAAREAGHPEPRGGPAAHPQRPLVAARGRRPRRPRIAYPASDPRPRGSDADAAALLRTTELAGPGARPSPSAARLAEAEGFAFVDVKHCHGYLLHEFLAARGRDGPLRRRVARGARAPRLEIARGRARGGARAAPRRAALALRRRAARTSPTEPAASPSPTRPPTRIGFGVDAEEPERIDLTEPVALVRAAGRARASAGST